MTAEVVPIDAARRKSQRAPTPSSSQDADDADLVTAALEGHEWAKTALFRRHSRPVAGLVARLLGNSRDVEDIVHETFIIALEEMGKLRDRSSFGAWIMQIAVSRAKQKLRRARLERFLGLYQGDDDTRLALLASPESSPEVRADLALLDEILERVPARQRIAWMLRVVEGRTVTEVAQLCRCSESTAKRRIRAVQRLIGARIKITGGRHG